MKIKFLDDAAVAVAPVIGRWLIRLIRATMRITYVNFEGYGKHLKEGRRMILAFWHGRLLMMPYSYPGLGITILVSASRDGELVSRTVAGFGIESVRGSSSKGWFAGVKGLLKSVKSGKDIAITPDGPRGPASKAQLGAIQIARATGLPIYPMTFGASKKKPSAVGTPS
ncbi:MAG: lysophospholipid acyltransferase family protein [Deltaproteobacteria bacterium]|nr:lysophospholipid acyltransferase family protein [Deltaproteobacteria bacterium]